MPNAMTLSRWAAALICQITIMPKQIRGGGARARMTGGTPGPRRLLTGSSWAGHAGSKPIERFYKAAQPTPI